MLALLCEWMCLSYGFGALLAGLMWQGSPPHAKHSGGSAASTASKAAMHAAAEGVVATLASLFGSLYLASLGMVVSPTFLWQHKGKDGFRAALLVLK